MFLKRSTTLGRKNLPLRHQDGSDLRPWNQNPKRFTPVPHAFYSKSAAIFELVAQ
jgi:hypothetical protein